MRSILSKIFCYWTALNLKGKDAERSNGWKFKLAETVFKKLRETWKSSPAFALLDPDIMSFQKILFYFSLKSLVLMKELEAKCCSPCFTTERMEYQTENPDFQNVWNKTLTSFPAFGNCFKIKSEKISLNFLVCSSVPLYISVPATLLQSLNIRYCFMIKHSLENLPGLNSAIHSSKLFSLFPLPLSHTMSQLINTKSAYMT